MNPYANPYLPPQADPAVYRSGPDASRDGTMVPDTVLDHLRATRPWVTFLAVVGLLTAGLTVILGLVVMGAGVMGKDGVGMAFALGGGSVYLVLGAFYVLPSVGLLRYGSAIGRLIRDPRMDLLGAALDRQRSFWKVVGIITAVMIALVPVSMLVGIAFYAAKAMSRH